MYYDVDALAELWKKTTFNLKKDTKNIDEEELAKIAIAIAHEIENGIERPPVTAAIYWGKKRKAAYAKIRVMNEERDAGKSNGYRCIVLVDCVNNSAFLLHIYMHGKGADNELDMKAKNRLKKLVDEYIESLGK